MKSLITLLIFCSLFFSCTHKAKNPRAQFVSRDLVQEAFEKSPYTAVEFPKGKSELTEMNKKFLYEFSKKANRSGKEIEEIKVLAWADKEYPGQASSRASVRDVILANARANVIREYIRHDLKTSAQIDVFNLAKKPDLLSILTKDEDFRIKEEIEESGVTATRTHSGKASYTKAGKVLVIIDYKDESKTN